MLYQTKFLVALPAAALLTGCSGGVSPSRDFDDAYFIGSKNADVSSNGLAFADGTQELSDVEGETLTIRLLRFERTPGGEATEFVVSNETAVLPSTFTQYGDFDATITLDGETLEFEDGVATLASGQRIWAYMNYRLEHSGTGAIYTYDALDTDFSDGIDTEGFFALGFETDPDRISARTDRVTYDSRGSFFGYVQLFDDVGTLVDSGMRADGAIVLEAEFAQSRISGRLEARLDPPSRDELAADPTLTPLAELELTFLGAPIIGNGFVGVADVTCPVGNSCTSDTSVSGVFFGPNGEEVSGVVTLDELISGPGGFSIKGAAGFSASSEPGT